MAETERLEGSPDAYPYALGGYHRAVTCANELAQTWFDRGMNWAFGFHHEEAIACFERAIDADPSCAMAHWGVAYSHGPNYNFHVNNGYYVVSQQETGYPSMKCAYDAIQRAAALTGTYSGRYIPVLKSINLPLFSGSIV